MKKLFKYDNEYISGWQYFFRNLLYFFLSFLLVGIYLMSVNAYKRARSLGHSETPCIAWAIWGSLKFPFIVVFMIIYPYLEETINPVFFIITIPVLYLWFKDNPKTVEENLRKDAENRQKYFGKKY